MKPPTGKWVKRLTRTETAGRRKELSPFCFGDTVTGRKSRRRSIITGISRFFLCAFLTRRGKPVGISRPLYGYNRNEYSLTILRGLELMIFNKVEICGVNTAKLPVLTNIRMRELLRKMRNGEKSARADLIQGNLRLVLSVIQRFNNRGEYVDDLFQVGCIGLMKAIDNFDLSQNVKFSTYAVPMIIGEIRRYLRDNNPLRVSRSLRDIAYKALQTRDSLANRYSQEPSIGQIAEELQIPREEIVFALDAIQEPISLFEPIYNDGGDPIFVLDQISDEKNTERRLIEGVSIKEGMENLGERERLIVTMRFYEGRTQMEVAEEIGISQAQVSRLEKAALRHLRKYMATS